MREINHLLRTKYFDDNDCLSNQYPRMQFKRDSYISLCGEWDFTITKDKNNYVLNKKIIVPYPVQSVKSKINKEIELDDYLIYHRNFTIDKNFIKDRVFLNVLGIDQEFDLFINNIFINHYIFLGTPLLIDITSAIKEGNNEITLKIQDQYKLYLPHGKQVIKPSGMWYNSVSGVYYPIFIESVNKEYIKSIRITPTLNSINLFVDGVNQFDVTIFEDKKIIYQQKYDINEVTINIDKPILWNPNNPFLYKIIIKSKYDQIESYFALRTIDVINNKIYLNNKEIFINGLLDQGYYPEGIYTVSNYNSYLDDILLAKKLGFNLLRKHIKVELDYFYYLCDKYGMLVMQDFVNNSYYKFIRDTALPTISSHYQKRSDKNIHRSFLDKYYFIKSAKSLINYLYNHPCIISYTIFNEGWGQFSSDKMYNYFKNLDTSRLFDTTSGWFRQNNSDFESLHIYFKDINNHLVKSSKPILISEFGGYTYRVENHHYTLNGNYSYKDFKSLEEYQNALYSLYKNQVLKNKDKLCGVIYTQLSDVEDETNGIITYDREIVKITNQKLIELFIELSKYN